MPEISHRREKSHFLNLINLSASYTLLRCPIYENISRICASFLKVQCATFQELFKKEIDVRSKDKVSK